VRIITSTVNLFCIPYGGGSASAIYGKWIKKLYPMIKVIPLELAGHGRRMSEPFDHDIKSIVNDLMRTIRPQLEQHPYALYAHSMGTAIAYELAVAARNAGLPQPAVLFMSGRQPPHYVYPKEDMHLMPDDVFIQNIISLGGTPPQLLESEALLKLYMSILRSDYRIIEQYRFKKPIVSFDADLVFFSSDQDYYLCDRAEILEWERYTTRSFEVYEFSGGHFFLNEVWQDICEIINRKLERFK